MAEQGKEGRTGLGHPISLGSRKHARTDVA
jgi:hypothetical protein